MEHCVNCKFWERDCSLGGNKGVCQHALLLTRGDRVFLETVDWREDIPRDYRSGSCFFAPSAYGCVDWRERKEEFFVSGNYGSGVGIWRVLQRMGEEPSRIIFDCGADKAKALRICKKLNEIWDEKT